MNLISNTPKIPRMRTIKEAAAEIKALDEHTSLTTWRIRELTLTGVLPHVKAGKKLLINLDTLIDYLENPYAERFQTPPREDAAVNGIRRIDPRR